MVKSFTSGYKHCTFLGVAQQFLNQSPSINTLNTRYGHRGTHLCLLPQSHSAFSKIVIHFLHELGHRAIAVTSHSRDTSFFLLLLYITVQRLSIVHFTATFVTN